MTTAWLDEREQRAWRGFQTLHSQLLGALSRRLLADSGLSDSDYAVLVALSEAPDERLRAHELCRELVWEKSRLSHQLRRMEERGLLRREACEEDARGQVVVLSAAGRRTIEAAAPAHVAAVRELFIDLLTRDQLDVLGDIAEAVSSRPQS